MAQRRTTVLVVDDNRRFRDFLSALLDDAGFETVTAQSAEEGLGVARAHHPDLAIVDVVLPGGSGYGLCRELRQEHGEELPVIFVSGERMDPIDRTSGILVGGDDYLVKPLHPEELLARIRRLLDRMRTYSRSVSTDLSDREVEVLQLVAEGRPAAEVASQLFISRKTVSSHMQRIFAKLNVHTRAQAVAVAYEAGLIRVPTNGHGTPDQDVQVHMASEPSPELPVVAGDHR